MQIIRELGLWMWSVISAWYGWVGASATAGMIGFGQGMRWWDSPSKKVYIRLILAGFVMSVFQSWVREHRKGVALTNDLDKLTWPDDRPKLSFHHWGKVEPQFLSPDARDNPFQLAQHGFYLSNDGGVALDIKVSNFPIDSDPPLLAVGGTTPRIESEGNGFAAVWIQDEVPLSKYALDVAMGKGFAKGRSDLTSVLTAHDNTYEVPISVTYRDFNNNWYITHCTFRLICDVWHANRLEFGAPTQERFTTL